MAEYSVPISEAIRAIRSEIIEARKQGEGAEVMFDLGPVEIEFQLVVSSEVGADGGINVGVLKIGGTGSTGTERTHRMTLTLTPQDSVTGATVRVSRSAV